MGGSILQLIATGAQDQMISSKPEITFWKTQIKRHSMFSVESIEQTFNGSIDWGKRISATIGRNGDLLSNCYLEITLTGDGDADALPYVAESVINEIDLEIGGTRIDRHYGDWFRIYDELYRSGAEKDAYKRMTSFDDTDAANTKRKFYLPLLFFFNRNPAQALPIIALQYHEVKINIEIAAEAVANKCGVKAGTDIGMRLYCDYVYLSEEERAVFAGTTHEYVIEQVQMPGADSVNSAAGGNQNVRLNFNHPTKYLAWVFKQDDAHHGKFTYSNDNTESSAVLRNALLQLNGHERMSVRDGSYFNQVQPFQAFKTSPHAGIYLYSFALNPRDCVQPSGTLNFSRIDNATLQLGFKTQETAASDSALDPIGKVTAGDASASPSTYEEFPMLKIFACSLNVLRISNGLGGLSFSN